MNSILVKLLVKDQGLNGSAVARGTVVCCATSRVVFVLPEFIFSNIEMMFLSFCELSIFRVTASNKL